MHFISLILFLILCLVKIKLLNVAELVFHWLGSLNIFLFTSSVQLYSHFKSIIVSYSCDKVKIFFEYNLCYA